LNKFDPAGRDLGSQQPFI